MAEIRLLKLTFAPPVPILIVVPSRPKCNSNKPLWYCPPVNWLKFSRFKIKLSPRAKFTPWPANEPARLLNVCWSKRCSGLKPTSLPPSKPLFIAVKPLVINVFVIDVSEFLHILSMLVLNISLS
jgi:hypothetical protein